MSGATHKLPVNSLLFLKLLLCREVSETRLGRDPWVTTLLARGREDRERDLRRAGSGEPSVLETAHRHSPGQSTENSHKSPNPRNLCLVFCSFSFRSAGP